MRTALVALAVFVAALAVMPARAAAPGDSDRLRNTLQARYEAMQAATDKRDSATLGKLLAPDFKSVSMEDQNKNRDQTLHDIGALAPKKPGSTASILIHDVRQIKDKAYVDETYRLDKVYTGRSGNARKWRLATDVNDTWVLVNGDWLLEKSVANTTDIFVDGVHMAHQIRGRKMKMDKSYKEEMKEKRAATPGGSCGGNMSACHAPPLPMSPVPPSTGH